MSTENLQAGLVCSPGLAAATSDPILLTPAFSTAEQSFGWNYLQALPALGYQVCSISVPDDGYGDLQVTAEYVVYAVRKMSAVSGRKVVLFGHQHGPLNELWALLFWPDIAKKVSTYIALATPFHGTQATATLCNGLSACSPSEWQIATGSNFLRAINARKLPAGLAYTSISSLLDEAIFPQPSASDLTGGTHIVLQDICPGRPIEHFTILGDNLTYLLVLDAIAHPGIPANPAHLPAGVCNGDLYMPYFFTPQNLMPTLNGLIGFASGEVIGNGTQSVTREPALRDYAATP